MPSMSSDDEPDSDSGVSTESELRTDDGSPRFETINWDELERSWRVVTAQRLTLLVGLAIIGALYLYDRTQHVYIARNWRVDMVDWVFLVALAIVVAYVVVPVLKNRESVGRILRKLRSRPGVMLASAYLGLIALLGTLGPVILPSPGPSFELNHYNPPAGFTTDAHSGCVGSTSGTAFDEVCRGTIEYPLGTGPLGERVELMLAAGARPTVYVALIGAVAVVPLATAVGVIAGLRGGLVDKLLMSYVDLQLSIPAILIYFLGFIYFGASLLLLLVAFALLSWGGIARLVRSEVIQRRGYGHVTVARSLGASESYVAKKHIIPNITNTLVPAVAHLLALLVLYEAGVAFLGFHEISVTSWGGMISESINSEVASQHITRTDLPAHDIWWMSTFPAIALALTMLSFKVVGDGLRDALDPREGQS